MKKIGDGAYGNVYLEGDRAVKRCFYDARPVGMLNLREMDVLHRLKGHPYIVNLQEVVISPPEEIIENKKPKILEKIQLHMNYMPTTLEKSVPSDKGWATDIDIIRRIMAQLLVALEYMHANRIIHRDLKPDNVLYNPETGKINVCDFGMCDIAMNYRCHEHNVTTFRYRAPEIFNKNRYSSEIDLWAAGCIMYFLLTGGPLFTMATDQIDNQEMLNIQRETVSKKLVKYRHDYRYLLEGLLKIDPRARLTATQALKDRFFDSVRAELIDPVREEYKPIGVPLERISLEFLPERKWIKETIHEYLKSFGEGNVLIYPIVFHGLDIFERFLQWNAKEEKSPPPPGRVGTDFEAGRYLTKGEVSLFLYTCLFIAHKYYTVVDPIIDWEDFFPVRFCPVRYVEGPIGKDGEPELQEIPDVPEMGKAQIESEEFEKFIITDVLEYRIFRFTLYEIAEEFVEAPTYKHYLQILNIYLGIPSWRGGHYRNIYSQFMSTKIASSY